MRRVVFVLALGLVAAFAPSAGARTALQLAAPDRSISWLTTGDSYSAGEGASGAEGDCQQSDAAAGPKAAAILRQERGWQISPHRFTACTGYLAVDLFHNRDDLVARGYQVHGHAIGLPPATSPVRGSESLADWTRRLGVPPGGFDVITVSLGGNDVRFSDIVIGCLFGTDLFTKGWRQVIRQRGESGRCDLDESALAERADNLFRSPAFPGSGSEMALPDMYVRLTEELLADGGSLVVLGYPRLLSPSDTWGRWRGGRCNLVGSEDADMLGRMAEQLDERMRSELGSLSLAGAKTIDYVSRLDLFDDSGNHHSLCGRTVEWINTALLFLRDGTVRPQRGFHPNDLGNLATAEAIAGVVEERLGRSPAPVTPPSTSSPPTVRSSEPHFDIGEPFDAMCVVAWPFAPSRGSGDIQMRTSCPDAPDQFLFVDIIYGDPDLPVTPNRARMRVRGEIIDVVRSEMGFTTLEVLADDIELYDTYGGG